MSIAWVDTETTGLDPANGMLLEVALVITDDDLVEKDNLNLILGADASKYNYKMDAFVQEMHTTNGLFEDIEGKGHLSHTADFKLVDFAWRALGGVKAVRDVPLAGSTVGFDRAWLKWFEAMFSHRSVDVSSFTEICKRWAPEVYAKRPGLDEDGRPIPAHRALADIRQSIETLRYYRRTFLSHAGGV